MRTRWRADGDVVLPGAMRYTLSTGDTAMDQWDVSVSLPPPMFQGAAGLGPFPTLYVLDTPMTFLVTAQIAHNTMGLAAGQLRPVAVVGIVRAVATGDFLAWDTHRNHDLSPTACVPSLLEGRVPYGTGGADDTLDLITHQIAPYLEDHHALDPADRGLAGWSLSGLTACWALLTRPTEFRRYLAASPAVWWDKHLLLDETHPRRTHRSIWRWARTRTTTLGSGRSRHRKPLSWPILT